MKKTVSGICTPRMNRNTRKLVYHDEFLHDNNTGQHKKNETTCYPILEKRMPFCGEANSENLIDFGKLPSTEIIITMENEDRDEYLLPLY